MNKVFFIPILLLAAFSCMQSSCKKDKQQPPQPAPLVNKLSCKVNGQAWESGSVNGGVYLIPSTGYKYIYIYIYNGSETLDMYMTRPFQTGIKYFNETTLDRYQTAYPKDYGSFNRYISGSVNNSWMTNSIDTGHCTITYIDTVNNLIKGSFSFKARSSQTGDVVNITEGYFEKVIR